MLFAVAMGGADSGHRYMTKDGRPSLINDIRLFAGDRSLYLEGQHEAVGHGRRMAWFLNSEGFSLGAFPALYVLFTPRLAPGAVRPTNDGGEWWHRYALVGVTEDFPNVPDALQVVMEGIVGALVAMRPDHVDTIRRADEIVREHGDGLRFLLLRRETKKLVVDISFNIEAWPRSSHIFISHTDRATAAYREADPIALGWYMEGFHLARGIRLQDAVNLTGKPDRPAMSGVVKRRA
jgi:hypothetical protein